MSSDAKTVPMNLVIPAQRGKRVPDLRMAARGGAGFLRAVAGSLWPAAVRRRRRYRPSELRHAQDAQAPARSVPVRRARHGVPVERDVIRYRRHRACLDPRIVLREGYPKALRTTWMRSARSTKPPRGSYGFKQPTTRAVFLPGDHKDTISRVSLMKPQLRRALWDLAYLACKRDRFGGKSAEFI